MKRCKNLLLILFFIASSSHTFSQDRIENSSKLRASFLAGYNKGLGLNGNITLNNFVEQFPFELRLGAGYTILNPGNAMDTRRIFINNATNGVPEKTGGALDFSFDFLLPTTIFKIENSYFIFGPRYSMFKGNFKYVGGNEEFDVKSQQWGIGLGIENHLKMTPKLDLVFALGIDYFFQSKLNGHDTTYSPDNDNVNPRKDNENDDIYFRYKDADKAINQPKFMPRAMLGISFSL
jgi:hypothetical protein